MVSFAAGINKFNTKEEMASFTDTVKNLLDPAPTPLVQQKIAQQVADNAEVPDPLFGSPGVLDDPLLGTFSNTFVPLTLPAAVNADPSPGVGIIAAPVESPTIPSETLETNTGTAASTSKVLQFASRADQPASMDMTQLIIFGVIAAVALPFFFRGR